ncbi:ArgP/LysG family DNA-binding transcriptional regulator [Microlunatus capsulatus]|uniref:LysR family transcriptional regulator (Chromosome initiation inhibitor) n=1 Tax=Microlunatus capsulatus TaxID=99117 RepID=A0ABS4Z5F5_9ACTN|nr:ArgP/LysG family DNA-binding transcriptional regulator [Microlunatus capsulatus]MBP2416273.1 LysR family transcriptional regulator (chromosome initiation inhibitor) [Microlunatus capsulatus]
MVTVQPEQAATLAAIVGEGTFDAAARLLHLTPSAVSQRVRALEVAVGRPVLRRVRPVELTEAGEAVVRFARQLELLAADLSDQLAPASAGSAPRITLVVNGDSLHTWALDGLATVADDVQLTVLREDQDHSLDLLRRGTAHGAVTATAAPVPGCSSRPLGVMRYRPVCSPGFAARWFPDGPTPAALAAAPVVVYDEKDDLQDRYLRRARRAATAPPRHHVPATAEFGRALQLGLGWGMLPDLQLDRLEPGSLRPLAPTAHLDVALHWQQWRLAAAGLDRVAAAVAEAARALRTPPALGPRL